MIRQVIDGPNCWAPYLHRVNGTFRMTYHRQVANSLQMVLRESTDFQSWGSVQVLRQQTIGQGESWGCSVIDRGPNVSEPAKRFKNIHYWIGQGNNGPFVDNSADGLAWEPPDIRLSPVVASDDQLNPFTLPGGGYGLFTKKETLNDPYPRETWLSFGDPDFRNWTPPVRAFWRDPMDPPDLEFYGATEVVLVGHYLVTFLRVLRNFVERGKGYTVKAWAHVDRPDCWTRSREPFLAGIPGTLDQAHAWIYGVVVDGATLRFSYSAYPDGHKTGPRHIGTASMPLSELTVG